MSTDPASPCNAERPAAPPSAPVASGEAQGEEGQDPVKKLSEAWEKYDASGYHTADGINLDLNKQDWHSACDIFAPGVLRIVAALRAERNRLAEKLAAVEKRAAEIESDLYDAQAEDNEVFRILGGRDGEDDYDEDSVVVAKRVVANLNDAMDRADRLAAELAKVTAERDAARLDAGRERTEFMYVLGDCDRLRADLAKEKARADAAEKEIQRQLGAIAQLQRFKWNDQQIAGIEVERDAEKARADRLAGEVERLRESLGMKCPYPLRDCLRQLADSADILLIRKGYDGHGHEVIGTARDWARKHADAVDAALAAVVAAGSAPPASARPKRPTSALDSSNGDVTLSHEFEAYVEWLERYVDHAEEEKS